MLSRNRGKLRDLLLFFGVLSFSVGTQTCYAQDQSDDSNRRLKECRVLLSEATTQMTTLQLMQPQKIILQERLYKSLGTSRWFGGTGGDWILPAQVGLAPDQLDPDGALPVSVTCSDVTLRVINEMRERVKEINLGKGNPATPPKASDGKGYDLTAFRGKTAEVKVDVTIKNTGKVPLNFSSTLFFAYRWPGLKGLVPVKNNEGFHDVVLDPGTSSVRHLKASMTINGIGDSLDGRRNVYTVLSITANNLKTGKEYEGYTVLVTTTDPWFVQDKTIKEK